METWVKPSGVEIQINAESREVARGLGWIPKDHTTVQPSVVVEMPKRRGRPAKPKEA